MHARMATDASCDGAFPVKRKMRETLGRETFKHVTVDVELKGEDCASVGNDYDDR